MSLLKSIHVDFSPAKTHRSEKFYEFAKRIIYNGIEISPFPISALKESSKSSDTLIVLLRSLKDKGFKFISMMSMVDLYFSLVKSFRSKLCKKIALNSYYFNVVLDLVQGSIPA